MPSLCLFIAAFLINLLLLNYSFPMPIRPGLEISQTQLEKRIKIGIDVISDPIRDVDKKGVYNTYGDFKLLVSGSKLFPVVMIKYPDFINQYSKQDFQNMLFGNWNSGSAQDYYHEVSYHQFTINGSVYGWFTADNEKQYYGFTNGDIRAAVLAKEAAQKADGVIDYAEFDNDRDGYVDCFTCVHAGYGFEETANGSDIWSHAWSFASAGIGIYTTNDPDPSHPGQFIKIDNYVIDPERSTITNYGTMAAIGVFCHEWGHALGLPDLYDNDGGGEGLGNWCLMAGGSWGGNGYSAWKPAHLCAWAKIDLGWILPTNVNQNGFYPVRHSKTEAQSYIIPATSSEYFLIENRRKSSFDSHLPGQGLLIYHIDNALIELRRPHNLINGPVPYGVALEQADGSLDLENGSNRGDCGDPFPGSTNNNAFESSGTMPDSRTNNRANTGCGINQIPVSADTIRVFIYNSPNPVMVWKMMKPVPTEPSGKKIKYGASLVSIYANPIFDQDLIFCLKGNKTNDFYCFSRKDTIWFQRESLPTRHFSKAKGVKRGGAMVWSGDSIIYATKGNRTYEWLGYNILRNTWQNLKPIPTQKGLKGGTGLAKVKKNGVDCIFLLKGSKTKENFLYYPETDSWEKLPDAPIEFKKGSCATGYKDSLVYVIKDKANLLYRINIQTGVWTAKRSLPFIGNSGKKKKVKDGAAMTADDSVTIYALKGGNTQEFWSYNVLSDRWVELDTIPRISRRKGVKAGGSIVYVPNQTAKGNGELYALKGNNTDEFWMCEIIPSTGLAIQKEVERKFQYTEGTKLDLMPNPNKGEVILNYRLNFETPIRIKIYDITGALVYEIVNEAKNANIRLNLKSLTQGVYLLKLESNNFKTSKKLIIQK